MMNNYNLTTSKGVQLGLSIVFGFLYHLAFGIRFIVDIGNTDPNLCTYPIYGMSKAAAVYFIYMAIYTLAYILIRATGQSPKMNGNVITRTVVALLTLPVLLTPAVYIGLIYSASLTDACPVLGDAVHTWFVFFCVIVGLIFIGLFVTLVLYIFYYGTGYQVPIIGYTFGPGTAIGGDIKAPEYQAV